MNIGFNSSATLTDINTYTITGDISVVISGDEFGVTMERQVIGLDKLVVIYNHDGLFADTKKSDGEPDALRIFRDTETHANMGDGTEFGLEDMNQKGLYEIPLHHDNALNIYAHFDF